MTSDNPSQKKHRKSSKNLLNLFKNLFNKSGKNLYDAQAYENLDSPRQDMIRGVFELSDENARDIMIPRVDIVAIESDTELKPIVKLVCEAGHSRLPVYEETIDNIIGILYSKNLLELLIDKSKKKFQLKKILHEPYYVPETMPLDELLFEFKLRKLHLAVVVDEYGGVAGIVTIEDILEEIVGEIVDEFDTEELPEFEKINKNLYEIDSRLPISELNEKLKLNLPTEEFDTIGGYIFDLFGKIPEKDESINDGKIQFTIKEINGTIINRILVSIMNNKKKPE